MREIIEDAALIFRQELDGLFSILVPGVVLAPVLLILAATSLQMGLALTPLIFLVYLGIYAASLSWAGDQRTSSSPSGLLLLVLLRRAPEIVLSAAPLGLLLVALTACGLVVADQGFAYLALLGAGAGFFAVARWLSRHSYELPLVVVYEASARQASAANARLDEDGKRWTTRLLMTIGAPIAIVGLIGVWLAWATVPLIGAAVFLLALTLWMPFASLCLVAACARLLGEGDPERRRPVGSAAR